MTHGLVRDSHRVVGSPSPPQVGLLLQCGADPNRPGHSGMTAIHMGARAGSAEVVKQLLLKGAKPGTVSVK